MARRFSRLTFASCSLLFFCSQALAETRVSQPLIPRQSKVRFGLQGDPLSFSGGFRTYSGVLERGRTIADSQISFSVDISKVRLDPAFGGLDMVSFEPLFQKIPHPIGKFVSTGIAPQSGNRFQVTGNWVRGGKTEKVEFPIVVVASSARESRLETSVVRRFRASDASIPVMMGPGGAEGSVSGELVFRAPK